MNLKKSSVLDYSSRQSGFTMVEIALCLAVVSFAMVVIMGILPIGSLVQKENREETLSLLDGNYLLQAIKNGAQGYDDLGLYVDEILLYSRPNATPVVIQNNVSGGVYWGTKEIVGLISAPQFLMTSSNVWAVNYINNNSIFGVTSTNMTCKLKMRSMNGTAADKNTSEDNRDFGMSYLVNVQVVPVATNCLNVNSLDTNAGLRDQMVRDRSMSQISYQISLSLDWPIRPSADGGYKTGANSQTFRTIASGLLSTNREQVTIPGLGANTITFWHFNPNEFSVTNNMTFHDDMLD